MLQNSSDSASTGLAGGQRLLPGLLLLFVGSGCAALIYEIVWFQLLRLVIGSSAISLAVLLGTFMGGMCIGALLFPRWCPRSAHPLRVYAILELLIGVFGIGILLVAPWINQLYVAAVGYGMAGTLLRALVATLCLLPPTIMMGATLPAIARWVELTPQGVAWLGYFYGSNIAGAVFGCLLAGFYLLRVHDAMFATGVAFGLNVAVFAIALLFAWLSPFRPSSASTSAADSRSINMGGKGSLWSIYLVTFFSGTTSLAAEVVWTRQLSLLLGASVYTFSIILAVFLSGLGVGSSLGSILGKAVRDPRWLLAVCQGLLIGAILWSAGMLTQSLPYWPIDPGLPSNPWVTFQLDIVRCLWAVFPAALLWGASFPLALAAAAPNGTEPGELVGRLYAANTVGAIVGAVASSLWMIPQMGTSETQSLLILLAAVSAAVVLALIVWSGNSLTGRMSAGVGVVGVLLGGYVIHTKLPPVPPGMIAYGRHLALWDEQPEYLKVIEGMNASIAVSENEFDERHFHVSGKVVASSDPADMRLQRMLGHFPSAMHGSPKSALVVGCGAGVTSGSFLVYPTIERVVICEIEPNIPPTAGKYFREENHGVMQDKRTEVIFDDARHFISTTSEKFDVITSDPIHPWVKGAAALYSAEYYELCKERLNPGGYITQWVPLYESSAAAVKSEIATFFQVFPNGTLWGNDIDGEGYDLIMLARKEPAPLDLDAMEAQLTQPTYRAVMDSLEDVGFGSAYDLAITYAGDAKSTKTWLADAEINQDSTMRLQYLAGMSLNLQDASDIYDGILAERLFPQELFVVEDPNRSVIRQLLRPRRRRAASN